MDEKIPIMDEKKMSQTQQRVIKLISKPHDSRSNPEIDMVLPWLKKKSDVMKGIGDPILKEIVRRCESLRCEKDEIIIRQGDIGECFYILLRGAVSVYISENKGGDEGADLPTKRPGSSTMDLDTQQKWQEIAENIVSDIKTKRHRKVNRKEFGKKIVSFGAGKAFGEIALLSEDSVRTASIISDEECDLMVINRLVYNSTLKTYHEKEFQERREFIENCVLFRNWNKKHKRQLERGLIKESYAMDMPIIKQGQYIRGLIFIKRGNAKVMVEPDKHEKQYPHLRPFATENDIYELENIKPKKRQEESSSGKGAREIREAESRSAVSRKSAPELEQVRHSEHTTNEQVRVKRKEGYVAAEKRMLNRSIVLCVVKDGALFGDIELVQNLKTFSHTVVTITYTEVFFVSIKNVERLMTRRNPQTMDMLQEIVMNKVVKRSTYVQGCHIPLVNHLVFKMTEEKKPIQRNPLNIQPTSKSLPDRFSLFQHIVDEYLQNKAELLETSVPGSVYYKAVMRGRANERARVRRERAEARRREIERNMRSKMMFTNQGGHFGENTDSEDEGIGEEVLELEEDKNDRREETETDKPLMDAPISERQSNTEKEPEGKEQAFMTEVSEKYSHVAKRSTKTKPLARGAKEQSFKVQDNRPAILQHQSLHTVCMVYDEQEQVTKITHTGSLIPIEQAPEGAQEAASPANIHEGSEDDERCETPELRAPSDARMVGAPAHMESRDTSRQSSSQSRRATVEIVTQMSQMSVDKQRMSLPPLSEIKNSSPRSIMDSVNTNRSSQGVVSPSDIHLSNATVHLPRVPKQTKRRDKSKSANVAQTQGSNLAPVRKDKRNGSVVSESALSRGHKSETCSAKSLPTNEDLELPHIEKSRKSGKRTRKSAPVKKDAKN